ncbi:ABC transporter ATP-binding protein [Schumannella luteola]|uniref:ABC-2 type transport system ATP-binding protein n=1 Tax=Schumannella luteola TaxID=472059 RepID=A0A852Y8M9_9MICO|nr:ABC transporter ATP-binding protein [Schumannella luteola]NYG98212.1 ABC-2 type transport system ATP-binding protein [Schumannella luteola]TPW90954.1 ABC transporter ATP-binding protein [Schumannella luteola]
MSRESSASTSTSRAADPVVRVRGLTKRYADRNAVDGIDFDIERGETFALLGPNGAGKSTTIEILEGYRRRTGGEVSVLGVDPSRGRLDWRSRLGIVLQSSGEPATGTVRQELRHRASFYPNPRDVDQTIAAVGLDEKADTRVGRLSGGQQRRLDVALGVIGRPELLFLDEPTTGFDPEARRQFWRLIRELSAEGTSILLTTHYLDEAAQLASRAGVIAGGRMRALGPLDELGGAAARVPIVRWRDAAGTLHEQRTERPAGLVAHLQSELARDAAAGSSARAATELEPRGLEVVRPSLEDIYLQLIAEVEREDAAAVSPGAPGEADTGSDADTDTTDPEEVLA